MNLEFKKWMEALDGMIPNVSNYNVTAGNQYGKVNPLIRGVVGFGANLATSHGQSFKNSLGSTLDGDNTNSQLSDNLISNFNVQGNFLQIDSVIDIPPDGNKQTAAANAVKQIINDPDAQRMANGYKANLNDYQVIKTVVDQENNRIKFTFRFKINVRTSDKLKYSFSNSKIQS